MKNRFTQIKKIASILLIFIGISCSEDFLNYSQPGSTTKEQFYKTDSEALQALMACYDNLQAGIDWGLHLDLVNLSDDVYSSGGQRNDNGGVIEEFNEFRLGPSNNGVKDLFYWQYKGIYLSNILLDNVDADTENKKLYIANAKVIRAFHYFNLVTLWGDVPLVLHELAPSEYAQKRVAVPEIWKQIEQDLSEALQVLPVKSKLPSLLTELASKGTAQALLGKAYLFQDRFQEAADQFDKVIASAEYNLYPDYSKIYRPESEQGVESVFEINFTTSKSYLAWPGSESKYYCFMLGPRESFFTPGTERTKDLLTAWGFLSPRKELYEAYIQAKDSVRRLANIISEAELIAEGGSMRNYDGYLQYGNDGFIRLKYSLYNSDGGDPSPKNNNGTNSRVIRFADVLLMAAEAHHRKEQNDDIKALQYLNRVRRRVSLPDLTVTGPALFHAIKLERRLELAFEGQRFQDLIRWKDAATVLADQGKKVPLGNGTVLSFPEAGFKSGRNELLPIPLAEMNVNPNMTQNPGY